jgi:hypothetical protein
MDAHCNFRFGVLALQADLLTAVPFADASSSEAARKDLPPAELLLPHAAQRL